MTDDLEQRHEPRPARRSEVAKLTFIALKWLVGLATLLVSLAAGVLLLFLAGAGVLVWLVIPVVASVALIATSNRVLVAVLLACNVSMLVYAGMMVHGVLNYQGGR